MLLTNLFTQMFLEPETDGGIDFLTLCGSQVHEEDSAADYTSLKSMSTSEESDPEECTPPRSNSTSESSVGRTPLHMAAESAASYEFIKSLISKEPTAAGLQDCHGVTPLMLAAAQGKRANKKTIKALIRASPRTVNVEDEEGMSAVEYALLSEVPHEILSIIQKSCAIERMMQDACERDRKVEAYMSQLSTEKVATSISYGQDIHNATRTSISRNSVVSCAA